MRALHRIRNYVRAMRRARRHRTELVGHLAPRRLGSGAVEDLPVPLDGPLGLRAAACHAASASARTVDLAYEAGGASSIYSSSPLQRCFRDVHVATQHVMVAPASAILAGRVLLGLDGDTTTL
mgnify:CR=1 FL=1